MNAIEGLRGFSLILVTYLSFNATQANASLVDSQRYRKRPLLYLCMGQLNSSAKEFRQKNRIEDAKLVGASSIDPDNNLTIHEDLLRKQIASLFPNPESVGVGVLDWEGKGLEILATGLTGSSEFIGTLNKFKRVIIICKQMRPNVKWSFYALPFRNYWNLNDAWRHRCLALTPLLKMCDFIAPSLYSLYPDSLYLKNNEVYLHENIQIALHISDIIDKDVYPFVWHRLPGNILMKKGAFMRHAKQILNERYRKRRVRGLIWYGEEVYGYNIKNAQILHEVGSTKRLSTYLTQLIQDYGTGLLHL